MLRKIAAATAAVAILATGTVGTASATEFAAKHKGPVYVQSFRILITDECGGEYVGSNDPAHCSMDSNQATGDYGDFWVHHRRIPGGKTVTKEAPLVVIGYKVKGQESDFATHADVWYGKRKLANKAEIGTNDERI